MCEGVYVRVCVCVRGAPCAPGDVCEELPGCVFVGG